MQLMIALSLTVPLCNCARETGTEQILLGLGGLTSGGSHTLENGLKFVKQHETTQE
jgi:hypothetical protein